MKKKNTNYLQKFDPILKEISEEYDIEMENLIKIIDYFFLTFKSYITDTRMPTIKITNFGTFKPSIGKLEWQMNIANFHIKNGTDNEDKLSKKMKYLSIIKDRLEKEREGKGTWKQWRNKKLEKYA